MKIALLAFRKNFNNYENIAFKNAALKKGIKLSMIDPDECSITISESSLIIANLGTKLEHFDYLLVRVGCMINTHVRHVIKAFKANGTIVSIQADDISLLADKFSTHLLMHEQNIPTINSMKARDITNYDLDYPLIFKSNTGSLGIGIYKVDDSLGLRNLVSHSKLLDNRYDFIIQDFINSSFGTDLRVFVVHNEIIAVMKRESDGTDFKANFTLHNKASEYQVDEKIVNIVDKITSSIDADILGIDLLFTKDNYLVCEINSAPGFKGLEKTYPKLKVADSIMEMIKQRCRN